MAFSAAVSVCGYDHRRKAQSVLVDVSRILNVCICGRSVNFGLTSLKNLQKK